MRGTLGPQKLTAGKPIYSHSRWQHSAWSCRSYAMKARESSQVSRPPDHYPQIHTRLQDHQVCSIISDIGDSSDVMDRHPEDNVLPVPPGQLDIVGRQTEHSIMLLGQVSRKLVGPLQRTTDIRNAGPLYQPLLSSGSAVLAADVHT